MARLVDTFGSMTCISRTLKVRCRNKNKLEMWSAHIGHQAFRDLTTLKPPQPSDPHDSGLHYDSMSATKLINSITGSTHNTHNELCSCISKTNYSQIASDPTKLVMFASAKFMPRHTLIIHSTLRDPIIFVFPTSLFIVPNDPFTFKTRVFSDAAIVLHIGQLNSFHAAKRILVCNSS